MKIGIITFHFVYNYGAMIQAYAMQEHLRLMGHESYIIDYAPEYHTVRNCKGRTWKGCFADWRLHRIPFRIFFKLFKDVSGKRAASFNQFIQSKYKLYPFSEKDDMSSFDCILLGSDQIWNQGITNRSFDPPYYGEGFNCRVFSYAASNRSSELTDYEKQEYTKRLSKLSCIGVRETNLQRLLQPLTNKKVYLNVDPTILAGTSVYENLNLSRPQKEKYVVVYEIDNHPEVQEMAKTYASKIGAKVVILVAYPNSKYGKEYDQFADPERFLAYIKNAECVFTTSFHGTALSLVFQKDFYAIRQHNSADMRIESLLKQLDQGERFVEMNERPCEKHVDYNIVTQKLKNIRQSSQVYLESAIDGTI